MMIPTRWLTVTLGFVLAANVAGQCETEKLLPVNPGPSMSFGSSVDVDGDTAVIGSRGFGGPRTATVYERQGLDWVPVQTLTGLSGGVGYTTPVALDGDTLMLGHPTLRRVYVYIRNGGTWSFLQELVAFPPVSGTRFGSTIALDGDRVAIGAPVDNTSKPGGGAVHMFERVGGNWIHAARLEARPVRGDGFFGLSVALEGDTLVVGEPGYQFAMSSWNRAFIFNRQGGTWQFEQVLEEPFGTAFGHSVDIDQGLVAISAYKDTSHGGPWTGSVIFFERLGTWQEVDRLWTLHPGATDRFGTRIALEGNLLAVGSWRPYGSVKKQPVQVFTRAAGGWTLERLLSHRNSVPDTAWGPAFGDALSIDGGTLWVGSPADTPVEELSWSGAVYAYSMNDLVSSYCGPANLNSTGEAAKLVGVGCPTLVQNDLALEASRLPPNQLSMFLFSRTDGFTPPPPGSQGNLCLGAPIARFEGIGDSGPQGSLMRFVDLAALPLAGGPYTAQPGETWNFQCWFRDLNPGPTSNFTDGVRITVR
jgi:FG-GAP repeat